MSTSEDIARGFVQAVNDHDLDRMRPLLDVGHRLTDSLGASVLGREPVLAAWRTYFDWMPDYRIEIEHLLVRQSRVALFGSAGGTFAREGVLLEENRWKIPAAWLARVAGGLLESWEVYADNKPVYEIMSRHRPGRTQG